jgi:hypothetical protein
MFDGRDDLLLAASLVVLGSAASSATIAIDEEPGGLTSLASNALSLGTQLGALIEDADGARYRIDGFASAVLRLGGVANSLVDLANIHSADVVTGSGNDEILIAMEPGSAGSAAGTVRVAAGAGQDVITIRGNGMVSTDLNAGAGPDRIFVENVLGGTIDRALAPMRCILAPTTGR